ncbi:MAG: nucleotide disphospho-sugar-binding domain-containing protein [Pseudomonadota bacterium]
MSGTLVCVELGRRLEQAGHDVTLATIEAHRERAGAAGLGFAPLPAIELAPFRCRIAPLGKNPFARLPARRRARLALSAETLGGAAYSRVAQQVAPDLSLIDFELHGPIVTALAMGSRVALIHHFFSTVESATNPPLSAALLPGDEAAMRRAWRQLQRWKTWRRWSLALRHWGGDLASSIDFAAQQAGLAPLPKDWRRWQYPWGYRLPHLVTGAAALDLPPPKDLDFRYIGPLIPPAQHGEPVMTRARAKAEKVILAAFGSMEAPPAAFVAKLWQAVASRADWHLVHLLPESAPRPNAAPPSNVTLVPWADQRAALRQADLMLNHGGAASVREAAAAGVPQVVLARRKVDWPGSVTRVLHHGIGLTLTETMDAPEMARAIATGLDDPAIRAAARAMADACARYDTAHIAESEVARLLADGESL